MSNRDEAWKELEAAATDYAAARNAKASSRLGLAAQSWALANGYTKAGHHAESAKQAARVVGTRGNVLRSGVVVPFGSSKGKPIEEESDKSLLWLIKYAREAIANPDKARFVDSNQALLDACLADAQSRGLDTEPEAF